MLFRSDVRAEATWQFAPLVRLGKLPGMLLGSGVDTQALVVGGLLVLLLVLSARPVRAPLRWLAAVTLVLVHLLAPHRAFGTSFLAERFAVFTLPALLLVLQPSSRESWRRVLRLGLVLGALGWLTVLAARFQGFNADARGFDALVSQMEPRRRVLAINFQFVSPYTFLSSPAFVHFAAWYQVEKGGRPGFSFAEFFPQLVRFRPGKKPRMTENLYWYANRFRWENDGDYDYFLIRASGDPGPHLFASATEPVRLVARSGRWWLYQREPRSP